METTLEPARVFFESCLSAAYTLRFIASDTILRCSIACVATGKEVAAAEMRWEEDMAELTWVHSALGQYTGCFLVGIQLWIVAALRPAIKRVIVFNMTDDLERAARGIYRLFRLDSERDGTDYSERVRRVEGRMVARIGVSFRRRLFHDYFLWMDRRMDPWKEGSPWCGRWPLRSFSAWVVGLCRPDSRLPQQNEKPTSPNHLPPQARQALPTAPTHP